QEAQTKVAALTELQDQFIEFLSELMRANRLESLIVAIDALDELPDPESKAAAITDFLPTPDKLPKGCFVLLTSRENLRPKIRSAMERLRKTTATPTSHSSSITHNFSFLEVSPADTGNRELLRAYLRMRLPETFRSPGHVETVLDRCG